MSVDFKKMIADADKKKRSRRKPTLAIDLDGVLHAYRFGYKDGTLYDRPVRGAGAALRKLMKTHNVFILSTRPPKLAEEWINKWFPSIKTQVLESGLNPPFWNTEGILGITQQKLAAEAYIDDRAIRFTGSWKKTLSKI